MNFDDEQLLVQKAAFLRDLPSENEHGNFCEKASFECTDCLFTGCLLVQPVLFDNWGCRPSNSTIGRANREEAEAYPVECFRLYG